MIKKIKKQKKTEKIDALMQCLNEWIAETKSCGLLPHSFGAFFALDPENNYEVKEDYLFAQGNKNTILEIISVLKDCVDSEKDGTLSIGK